MYERTFFKSIPTYSFLLCFFLGVLLFIYGAMDNHFITALSASLLVFSLLQVKHCYTLKLKSDELIIRHMFLPFLTKRFKHSEIEFVSLSLEPMFFNRTLRLEIKTEKRVSKHSLGYIYHTELNHLERDLKSHKLKVKLKLQSKTSE